MAKSESLQYYQEIVLIGKKVITVKL